MHEQQKPVRPFANGPREAGDCPVLLLEVTHGQTQYPFRPVTAERFLVGSSSTCDLCLGSDDFPALHSMVIREEGMYRWEAVMSAPALIHNGQSTDSCRLKAGDHIQLGTIELTVHFVEQSNSSETQELVESVSEEKQQGSSDDLVDLSALELLERMDEDRELVELFESRRQLGLQALLHATRAHVDDPAMVPDLTSTLRHPPQRDDGQLLASLEHMAEQLNECAKGLEHRATAIAAGHERLAKTLQTVMDAERHLAERLATVFEKIPLPADDSAERTAA